MANILFTHSYFYRFDPKQWAQAQPYPPYGTIYAAAKMREDGHEVSLFDTNLVDGPENIRTLINTKKPKYLVVYDDGFNYLTKMCLTNMRNAAFEMIGMGKEKGSKIIVASSDSTDHFQDYLDAGADFIILGEGEITLSELITALEEDKALEDIPGIAYKKGNQTIRNSPRPVLKDLDSLPNPAWDLIDIESYKKIWLDNHGYFSLNIATTRGCPFKCNWCAKPIYGNRYNTRSPQRVAEEMQMLVRDYGAEHFWMCDDIFGLKPNWVQEFRDYVRSRNYQFKYKIQSRVDLLLKEDTIDALAASGLKTVWVGAESGSQKILDAMDKGTSIDQIYKATEIVKKKGIEICFFLQFGYLGEEKEDIRMTLKMLKDLMPDDIGVSVSYPLPGTGFYETVKSQLSEKQNWTDSDDLAMMYKGTFSAAFYRRLHRYVHKTFRKRQAFQNLRNIKDFPNVLQWRNLKSILSLFYYIPASALDNLRLKQLEN